MEKEILTSPDLENTNQAQAEEAIASVGEDAVPTEKGADAQQTGEGIHTDENENVSVSDSLPVSDSESADKSSMRQEFERLIKGEYKEFYEERVRDNISRRFKENAYIKKQNQANREIVEMLCDRYNLDTVDIPKLKAALESDDAYLAAEADKRGMSIDNYKYVKRLENQNRRFLQREAQLDATRRANQTVEKWFDESTKLKETYPDFDIFAEAKNPSFVSLIKRGIDVKTAYEVVHHTELLEAAQRKAARDAEIKTAQAIRQKSVRPAENGLSQKSSAIYSNGVSSLTAKEREDIARRVSRGERITF